MNAKMLENAPGEFVTAEIGLEAELNVRLDRVGAAVLQLISAEFVHQTDTAAFLMLVNENAPALFANRVQCEFQLGATIAAEAVEYVARQTLRMNADERRRSCHVAEPENHGLFNTGVVPALETEDPEMSKTTGEIGFRCLDELKRCTGRH